MVGGGGGGGGAKLPIGNGPYETMFPASPFVYKEYRDYCVSKFGVEPRPH